MISSIVLTRPQERGNNLKLLLLNLGYNVIDLPCLAINYLNQSELIQGKPDIYIFVSVNAVYNFFRLYPDAVIQQTKIMAIGSETAKALTQHGVYKVIYPSESSQQTSEYFVNLPELVNIKGKKIILVRGETSREYIAHTIRERQANLQELIVYKTNCPDNLAHDIFLKLNPVYNKELLIIITSNRILENFYNNLNTKTNKALLDRVLNSKLLVVSDRIANLAKQRGFRDIIVSNTMNEEAIIGMIEDISS